MGENQLRARPEIFFLCCWPPQTRCAPGQSVRGRRLEMTLEMRRTRARESFTEKIRKVQKRCFLVVIAVVALLTAGLQGGEAQSDAKFTVKHESGVKVPMRD